MTMSELTGRGDDASYVLGMLAGDQPEPASHAAAAFELDHLARTGFPAARSMPDPGLFLEAYASLVSQRAGDEGRDASRLLRTLRVLATLTGQAAPDQRIWQSADINKATLRAYDDLLERVHLAAPVPAFESNRLKRLTAYPKRFLADTALALTLAGLDAADLGGIPLSPGAIWSPSSCSNCAPTSIGSVAG